MVAPTSSVSVQTLRSQRVVDKQKRDQKNMVARLQGQWTAGPQFWRWVSQAALRMLVEASNRVIKVLGSWELGIPAQTVVMLSWVEAARNFLLSWPSQGHLLFLRELSRLSPDDVRMDLLRRPGHRQEEGEGCSAQGGGIP